MSILRRLSSTDAQVSPHTNPIETSQLVRLSEASQFVALSIEDSSTPSGVDSNSFEPSLLKAHSILREQTHFYHRLWNYLRKDGDGKEAKEDFSAILGQIGQNPKSIDELWGTISDGEGKLCSDDCVNISTKKKKRTLNGRVRLWVIQYVLVFLFAFTTNMPYIFLAPEILARGGTLTDVGIVLGVWQACRTIANTMVATFGSKSGPDGLYIMMVMCGLAGWIAAIQLTGSGVWGMLGFIGVGLSEVIVPLQVGLLAETKADSPFGLPMYDLVMNRLRRQYSAVTFGAMIAFAVSGWLYDVVGFIGVCYLGAAVNGLQLVLGIMYILVRERGNHVEGTVGMMVRKLVYKISAIDVLFETVDGSQVLNSYQSQITAARNDALQNEELQSSLKELYSELSSLSLTGKELDLQSLETIFQPSGIVSKSPRHLNPLGSHRANANTNACRAFGFLDYNNSGICTRQKFLAFLLPRVQHSLDPNSNEKSHVFPYVYFVVASHGFMGLCIGTFMSTAVLQYQYLGVNVNSVGILLAVGEVLGFAVLWITSTKWSSNLLTELCKRTVFFGISTSRPFHCITVLCTAVVATFLFGSPFLPLAIVGQLALSAINDFMESLFTEVTAGAVLNRQEYLKVQSFGQGARRVGNITAGVTGPILFGIHHFLPWGVYGCIVFIWTMVLWGVFYSHAIKISEESSRSAFSAFKPFVEKSWFEYEVAYAQDIDVDETMHAIDFESNIAWLRVELNHMRKELDMLRDTDDRKNC